MRPLLSPLRYPGSKRSLVRHIEELIEVNSLEPDIFIEMFAGGATVSLQLLDKGIVGQIGLIEKDPLVAAFWSVIFSETDVEWLIEQVQNIEVSLDKWRLYKSWVPEDRRERALACLYLNRTSFSGILAPTAGPIGGYTQSSEYTIDCRFPRETLVQRIRRANALRDRVAFVWQIDWSDGLKRICEMQHNEEIPQNALFYFDPPFFNKADKLYTHYFMDADHTNLRDTIVTFAQNWVLSYDYSEKLDELYSHSPQIHIDTLYSAAQNGGQRVAREVILTNLPRTPESMRFLSRTVDS